MNHSTHTVPSDDSHAECSTTAALEALRVPRRREILNRLADRGAVEISTLASEIAACAPTDAESNVDRRDAAETALRHVDLPKLADLGFVAVDPDRDVVRLHPSPTLSSLLAIAAETDATA